ANLAPALALVKDERRLQCLLVCGKPVRPVRCGVAFEAGRGLRNGNLFGGLQGSGDDANHRVWSSIQSVAGAVPGFREPGRTTAAGKSRRTSVKRGLSCGADNHDFRWPLGPDSAWPPIRRG